MTVLRIPARHADRLTSAHGHPTDGGNGARMRAHSRHQGTVVTISGDIDASNSECVHDFATRFVLVDNALILDLSGVEFFAARGVSVLIAVDDACRTAQVPWALVGSRAVSRVLQLTECDTTLPTANSVPEALRQATAHTRARRQLALLATTAQRHAV
jgi:anti-anti-sigma factor